jgi:flagellar hook protein FlgE
MSFQHGLSGLNSASVTLDTIGNNIANSSTVGFKAGQAQFADVYASSLNNASGSKIGIGSKVAQIMQQFTQGNTTTTNNPLDIAINGNGFFRMSDNGSISYSRNGQFLMDKEGYVVNASGSRLTGYMANAQGVLATGQAVDLQIKTNTLEANPTTKINTVMNLDPRNDVITSAFDPDNPATYTNATTSTVYDSLGVAHVVQTYFVKVDVPGITSTSPDLPAAPDTPKGVWNVYVLPDTAPAATNVGSLLFDGAGKMVGTLAPAVAPATKPVYSATGTSLTISMAGSPNANPTMTFDIDYAGATQAAYKFGVSSTYQDGYASGRLSNFNISEDGFIVGNYTNGKTGMLGQVVLANFRNPNGLQPLGDNQWAETAQSGQALVGAPDSTGMGVLQSYAVEDSNVDLTAELVNMITAQRVYQANAQTIKTEDQVMQTLVNLR